MKKSILAAVLVSMAFAAQAQVPAAKGAPAGGPAFGPASDAELTQMAKAQVERFDTDNDGKASLKEFLKPGEAAFARIDTNKDGFLTVEEFKNFQLNQQKAYEKMRSETKGAEAKAPAVKTAPAGK